jgi:isopenicillin N synthase-like dioxygenase
MGTTSVPVIDISGYLSGNPSTAHAAVAAVRAAAISPGFFQITGHGIPASQTERFFDAIHRFFALPQATKDAMRLELQSYSMRGYERLGTQHLEKDIPDLKEGFLWGGDIAGTGPDGLGGLRMTQGPNKWPPEGECPGFREELMLFLSDGYALAKKLLRMLALSLELSETYFDALLDGKNASFVARAHKYHPKSPDVKTETRGVGAHTDFGALTLLVQDDS